MRGARFRIGLFACLGLLTLAGCQPPASNLPAPVIPSMDLPARSPMPVAIPGAVTGRNVSRSGRRIPVAPGEFRQSTPASIANAERSLSVPSNVNQSSPPAFIPARDQVEAAIRTLFGGVTNWGGDRLAGEEISGSDDALQISIRFNADIQADWSLENADIRSRMATAYGALYGLGPAVGQVTLQAYLPATAATSPPRLVLETRVDGEVGHSTDWRSTLDLDRVWQMRYSALSANTSPEGFRTPAMAGSQVSLDPIGNSYGH